MSVSDFFRACAAREKGGGREGVGAWQGAGRVRVFEKRQWTGGVDREKDLWVLAILRQHLESLSQTSEHGWVGLV